MGGGGGAVGEAIVGIVVSENRGGEFSVDAASVEEESKVAREKKASDLMEIIL